GALTANGAYGSFSEAEKGTLDPGKLADVAVLDRDIFARPPEALFETRAELTILGGQVVYDREGEVAG
ncbi:MAG: amidohydrolase family protein, partial [Rhodospirillales bacterium]|nr:amidohydrolase family protein [Rhodospirillales bacterium]